MQPKSYVVWKWALYALATFLLACLQRLVLERIVLWGTRPFIWPMLAALAPLYEGKRQGAVFSLILGFLCDLLLPGPFPGFYGIAFTLTALTASAIGEELIAPGFFAALISSLAGLLLTGGLRVAVHVLSGGAYPGLMCRTALLETLLTLPAIVCAAPLYRAIHRRCAAEY